MIYFIDFSRGITLYCTALRRKRCESLLFQWLNVIVSVHCMFYHYSNLILNDLKGSSWGHSYHIQDDPGSISKVMHPERPH